MSVAIRINSGTDEPFAVEINSFPTSIELEKPNSPLEILPFGLFLMVFLYFAVNAIAPAVTLVVLTLAGGAMLALSFWLMRQSERKDVMIFDRQGVSVTEAGLFTDHKWQASYSDFEGVVMRRRQAKSGRSYSIYQIIELKHPDPQKTLPLFVRNTNVAPKKRLKTYGELFDLPARREGT